MYPASRPSIIIHKSKDAVIREYSKSSKLPLDSQKAMWGSEKSMLNRFHLALRLIDWKSVESWLDIGCGTGRFFQVAEKANHKFCLLEGVDLTQSLIDQARTRKFNSPTHFQINDLEHLGDTHTDFNLVTLIGVLQLCGCPLVSAIKAGTRCLKPGGQLFFTTKHLGWNAFEQEGLSPDPNHSWFTFEDVRNAVETNGLEIIEAKGFIPEENNIVELNESHTLFVHARKLK